MQEKSQYVVLYPDETRGAGSGPSSPIPTLGAATTAIDQYRTVAVVSNLKELGAAFTDINAVAAISRIAEGGITSIEQLEAAETALQALLLHETVHVLLPSPKAQMDGGLITYLRNDGGQRTEFGFELFNAAHSRDWLIAPEFVKSCDGIVISSTIPNSSLMGKNVNELINSRLYYNEDVVEAVNVAIESHQIPAYLTDPMLIRSRRGDGFAKRFYHRIRLSWDKAVDDITPLECSFALPPLLAIVLNRLNNRADLKSVIVDLRAELCVVRKELLGFNKIITESASEAEINARIQSITSSFDAIVPESRMSKVQKRRRRIMSVQGIARPLIKFAMGFATKGGANLDDGLKLVGSSSDLLIESKAFIDRTVTARTFVGLFETESLQSLVKHHLSESEILAIEKSIRMRKK